MQDFESCTASFANIRMFGEGWHALLGDRRKKELIQILERVGGRGMGVYVMNVSIDDEES